MITIKKEKCQKGQQSSDKVFGLPKEHNKPTAKGQRPLQKPEFGLHSGPFIIVYIIKETLLAWGFIGHITGQLPLVLDSKTSK